VIASSRSLVIFANAPEKGRVKSRIAADLGPDVALTAYKTLAEHAVAAASQVDWCRKTIAYAPNGTGDAMRDWFGDLFDYRAQGDGDLGPTNARGVRARVRGGCRPRDPHRCRLPGL
jgi:glycosyltransferase A (GT-A) superfamily protein (DUF2064 family)